MSDVLTLGGFSFSRFLSAPDVDAQGNPVMTDAWIGRLVSAAGHVAFGYVGVSEQQMLAELAEAAPAIEAEMSGYFGSEVGATMAQSFLRAVVLRRREIDAGAVRPVLVN
jgi:hypothetical protein